VLNPKSKIQNLKFSLPALALALAACGASPKPPKRAEVPHPNVTLPSGAVYTVEVARTPEEQAQGLMFRESLPERSGMIFLFSDKEAHQFWMKNTMIPLDMVWMDERGKVLFISAETPPCKADPCPSYGPNSPAAMVLEIAGGMAAREKIVVGSALAFKDVK
jgi:uncharacterized membrane protein (UPF0127 family)